MDIGHIAPLFIVGSGLALIGWALVYISARIERQQGVGTVHAAWPRGGCEECGASAR
jgi:hypothetical protein